MGESQSIVDGLAPILAHARKERRSPDATAKQLANWLRGAGYVHRATPDVDALLRRVQERVGEFFISVAPTGKVYVRWVEDHAAEEYAWLQANGATLAAALQAVLDREAERDA